MKKVVLAGGTGFLGHYFTEKFSSLGYDVLIISRNPQHISWENTPDIMNALNGAEMLINLAGKSVNCRYNETNKREIFNSRTETTKTLGNAILACSEPPALWLNSSTATIYRHAEDRPMTETTGEIGSGFSVEVAKAWEEAFFSFKLPATRQAALRISIVLGKDGGVMIPLKKLVSYGLGGKQGPGTQKFSWIHIEDLFRMIMFMKDREELQGVINCASPYPTTNEEFMSELRRAMNMRFGLPAPSWLLEIGAVLIRTETELVLKSRWVVPERLEAAGFVFRHPTLREALQDLVT
ncbi:TIGR01777 family oxidoreductase [Paenibacillus turpanensis]|uniref:TIGR01777 family oxidoreductase n=1 Tax=Paenibacillus turpanensis TaxID=2689078 RepID=UPI00140A2CEE|nr:TIGR01777 family oxidoreductase [Paenibacillus turpanensis]